MKYATPELLQNAFLKVFVAGSPHRLYFRDVKTYKKLNKRIHPPLPDSTKDYQRRRLSKQDLEESNQLSEEETKMVEDHP